MRPLRPGSPAAAMRGVADGLAALTRFRRLALAMSAGWAVLVLGYAIGFLSVAPDGGTRFIDAMFFLAAMALPLVLVWLAAWLAEELDRQRRLVATLAEATGPLIGALAATREAVERHATSPEAIQRAVHGAMLGQRAPDISGHLDRLQSGQTRLESALRRLAATPPARPALAPVPARPAPAAAEASEAPSPTAPVAPSSDEPALPLIPGPEVPPLAWADLVRALDFPRDADDRDGFRALKAALRHHRLAMTLQAAEDVLNLLSQEGVFVDELAMDPVDVTAWRRFMAGVRGAGVDRLGGIRDPRALDAARGLMKSDSIFRDSALFFQRRFDSVLSEHARNAGDAEIEELAGTRSGRAFMLLVRLSGSLD